MAKHRIGLIGLGMVAGVHAHSLMDLAERAEVVAAFSPSAARREAFAARFPFPTVDSLQAIIADPSIDTVVVITPANTHLDIVRRAAAAGKHVLLEKPVEITTARATELVELCEAAGVTLGIVLQHRQRATSLALRAALAEGRLGDLAGCSTVIRLWRPQSYYDEPGRGSFARDGGGVLMSQGIHTLDLMLSLAGPVREVRGYAATSALHRMETEDMVMAALRYENGAIGTVDATTAAYPGFPERIELIGTRGTAVLAGTSLEIALLDGTRQSIAPMATPGGTGADPMAFPHDWHRNVLTDFLDALDSGGRPTVTGREALRVHRLIDALIAAGASETPVPVATE